MAYKALIGASLDPLTNGHLWMIRQAAKRFDLTLAVAYNPAKKYVFGAQDRLEMLTEVMDNNVFLHQIDVETIADEYLVEFAHEKGIDLLIRGIRDENDFRYERNMRHVNAKLAPDIDTIFMMPPQELEYVSSSFVRGMCGPKGWEKVVNQYVPSAVYYALLEKYKGEYLCISTQSGALGGCKNLLTASEKKRIKEQKGGLCDKCTGDFQKFMQSR